MVQFFLSRLQEMASDPSALLLALGLGAASAIASACCTLPAMAVLIGYSGAQAHGDRAKAIRSALYFTLGVVLALIVIGGVAGFVGRMSQAVLGSSWKVVAGIIAVALGLATLDLLPVKLGTGKLSGIGPRVAQLGPALAGLALGGIVAVSSLPCNPGIFIVIGAAVLQGRVIWAMLLLGAFAIGFSLPLGAVMLGISLSRVTFAAKGMDRAIRWVCGSVLVAAGLYFVITA